MRILALLAAAVLAAASGGAGADEDADHGVAPTRELRLADYSAPTPRELPGAKTIGTAQLAAWLERDAPMRPLLFDVIGDPHRSIPGAIWLPGAGRGRSLDDPLQARLAEVLARLTSGDTRRPMVFVCANAHCWLSYNAALRATVLGYREVYWYRGGLQAWIASSGRLAPMRMAWKKSEE
jgi:PQQ-dependent catabolism-associated CXXCW motif protein